MEKESFENEATAEIMNKYFINIKVDREERPDVDRMYMAFVQATVGGGGWPLSVFLTPDLEPLTGGTYFPPEDMLGRPSFKTVLKNIAQMWGEKTKMMENAGKIFYKIPCSHTEVIMFFLGKKALEVLKSVSENELESSAHGQISVPSAKSVEKCLHQLERSFDEEFGGFSTAPKFPQPSFFNLLFHIYSRNRESPEGTRALDMCLKSLKRIAYGGIHDHVNSGNSSDYK